MGVLVGIAITIGLVVTTVAEGVDPLLTLGGLGTVALVVGAVWLADRLGV
jgi:hypothetical protein